MQLTCFALGSILVLPRGYETAMKMPWPAFVVLIWLLLALFGQGYSAESNQISLQTVLCSPDAKHILGCDDLGRDIALRLCNGAWVSLLVASCVTLVALLTGTLIGLLAGYFGGWWDHILMRITDIFLAFPGFLLAIALASVLGSGLQNLLLALSLTGWVSYARLTRVQTIALRQRQHIIAAQALGAKPRRILARHILPLLLPPLLVEASYGMAGLIVAEASLSFLGLGIPAPDASWGSMLRDGTRYLLAAPHYVIAAGVSLMSLVLAVNLLGDHLRDRLDSRNT